MTERQNARLSGVFCVVLSAAFIAFVEYEVRTEGTYGLKLAFLGPACFVMGCYLAIRAPTPPIKTEWQGVACLTLAAAAGFANLYRYGAFEEGSVGRVLIGVGLASGAIGSVFEWFKSRNPK